MIPTLRPQSTRGHQKALFGLKPNQTVWPALALLGTHSAASGTGLVTDSRAFTSYFMQVLLHVTPQEREGVATLCVPNAPNLPSRTHKLTCLHSRLQTVGVTQMSTSAQVRSTTQKSSVFNT